MFNQSHQFDTASAYPLFKNKLSNIRKIINTSIYLNDISSSNRNTLFQLDHLIQELILLMDKKPAISNINIESIVNETYSYDPEIHGIRLNILFYKNSDPLKIATRTLNLRK